MAIMAWDASLQTGHDRIDADHKRLVDLVNRLGDAMAKGQGKDVCGKVLAELVSYTKTHFRMEEHLMSVHEYPQAHTHKAQHDKLVQEVAAFKAKFDSGAAMLSISLLNFLKNWLAEHIKGSDKAFVGSLAAAAK